MYFLFLGVPLTYDLIENVCTQPLQTDAVDYNDDVLLYNKSALIECTNSVRCMLGVF